MRTRSDLLAFDRQREVAARGSEPATGGTLVVRSQVIDYVKGNKLLQLLFLDLGNAVLAFAATNDRLTNHRIGIAAKGKGVFANIADSAEECHFIVPARVQRGSVHVAISTGGENPRLSAELRKKLDEIL